MISVTSGVEKDQWSVARTHSAYVLVSKQPSACSVNHQLQLMPLTFSQAGACMLPAEYSGIETSIKKKFSNKRLFLLETNVGFRTKIFTLLEIVLFHCSMCVCCSKNCCKCCSFFFLLFAYITAFVIIIDRVAAGTCHGFAVGNFFLKAIVLNHCTILEGNGDLFSPM